jgi:hypothetical protein
MPAVGGSVGNGVTSKKPLADENAWMPLNDGDDTTVATVQDNYVELDLGEWGTTVDMVKVHHWQPGLAQGMPNGIALYVMDTQRRVVLHYMFHGIGAQSPVIQEIPVVTSDTKDSIDDAETAVVRYLKLTRVQPGIGAPMYNSPIENHMNIIGLEAFLGPCTPTFFYINACGWRHRYYALDGYVSDIFNWNDWPGLNDGFDPDHGRKYCKHLHFFNGDEGLMGHTNNTPGAVMQLDFGPEGRKTNRVRILHRMVEIRRSNGMKLEAIDPQNNVIFTHVFRDIGVNSPATDAFNMKGEKVNEPDPYTL